MKKLTNRQYGNALTAFVLLGILLCSSFAIWFVNENDVSNNKTTVQQTK